MEKVIQIKYNESDELGDLISKTIEIERSSKVSLAKRSIINYCKKILEQNAIPKSSN